jgi:hypothetical protein
LREEWLAPTWLRFTRAEKGKYIIWATCQKSARPFRRHKHACTYVQILRAPSTEAHLRLRSRRQFKRPIYLHFILFNLWKATTPYPGQIRYHGPYALKRRSVDNSSSLHIVRICYIFFQKVARAGERTRDLLVFHSFIFPHSSAEPQRLPNGSVIFTIMYTITDHLINSQP